MDILEAFTKYLQQIGYSKSSQYALPYCLQEFFDQVKKPDIKKINQQNPKVIALNQLRTSVITHWLKLYNLRQVQNLCGHRYVSSTEGYLVNDLEDLSEEIEKYHPI